jgi:hypothetical protein
MFDICFKLRYVIFAKARWLSRWLTVSTRDLYKSIFRERQVFITGVWESQIIITTRIRENGLWCCNGIWRGNRWNVFFPYCYQLSFHVANSMEVALTTGRHQGKVSFICSRQKYFFAILNTKTTNIWDQPPTKFCEVFLSFPYQRRRGLTITRWREIPIRTMKLN